MSQQSPSIELETTWGKFSLREKAQAAQSKLSEAGIDPQNITLETENFSSRVKLEDTEAISNLKSGAIAGAVLGAIIGLSISLLTLNFVGLGLAALKNFQTIHYFAPIMGAIVGAAGISLILGLSGASVPKDNRDSGFETIRYLLVVKGTAEEVALGREIIAQQGGVVEEEDRR